MQVDDGSDEESADQDDSPLIERATLVRFLLFCFLDTDNKNYNKYLVNLCCCYCDGFNIFLQDLETYITAYKGLAKLQRLRFIAMRCPSLRIEALRTGITAVMQTCNTGMYQLLHKMLSDAIAR